MTSKTSYNNVGKYIWQQLRATRSFILLVAVVYMAIGPLLLALSMSSLGVSANPLPMLQMLFKDYYTVYFFAAVAFATLGVIYVTRYQNVQTQSNYYHSLPVSRSRLLAGRVLALVIVQLLLLLIVTVASIVASMLFARSIGESAIVGPLVQSAALHFVYIMLVFLLAMAITLFAGQLTASTVGQILMTVVLHATVLLLSGVGSMFLDSFAETHYSGGWTSNLVKFNIFYLFANVGNIDSDFEIVNPLMTSSDLVSLIDVSRLVWPLSMTLICVGLTVVLLVGSFLLYRRRAVEKAGDTLMFAWVGSAVKAIYVIIGGLFGGFALFSMASHSFVAFVLGVVIAAVVVHIVAEMIYSQDVNGIRQHWLSTLVPMALAIAVAFLFHSGIVNYDDHLPKADSIEAAAISFNDSASDGKALSTAAAKSPETINKVVAAMEAANAARIHDEDMMVENAEDEVKIVPTQTLVVSYKTALGGKTSRYYNVPTEDAAKIMAPFLNDSHYYEATWSSLMNMELENVAELLVDGNGFADFASIDSEVTLIADSDTNDKMSKTERATRLERSEALLQAMKSDLKKRNADVLASRVVGYVTYGGATGEKNSAVWGMRYPVYADDSATVALLQDWRDQGILPEEHTTLSAALTGMAIKTVTYDDSEQGYTVTGTMSNEDFINAWLAGDFVYTDQADRYGFDVNKKQGVIVVDATSDTSMPVSPLMRDVDSPSDDVSQTHSSYASFYYKNKADA